MTRPVPYSHPACLTLRAYPPEPARIELVYQPVAGRLGRTLAALALFWGIIPWVVWLPPHYPWPALCFVTGGYLAHRFWTGKYRVRLFVGTCPRCGKHLRIDAGTTIDLPHTLTCFGCHFEPRLEVISPSASNPASRPDVPAVRHLDADCVGRWRVREAWGEEYLACGGCGGLHLATPAARSAADAENERADLLERLAYEGRFLG